MGVREEVRESAIAGATLDDLPRNSLIYLLGLAQAYATPRDSDDDLRRIAKSLIELGVLDPAAVEHEAREEGR